MAVLPFGVLEVVPFEDRFFCGRPAECYDGRKQRKMLKLGTIRFHSRCDRHPAYDPADGPGAIRGGCLRCGLLLDIHQTHIRLVELIRQAKNQAADQAPKKAAAATTAGAGDPRQGALF